MRSPKSTRSRFDQARAAIRNGALPIGDARFSAARLTAVSIGTRAKGLGERKCTPRRPRAMRLGQGARESGVDLPEHFSVKSMSVRKSAYAHNIPAS